MPGENANTAAARPPQQAALGSRAEAPLLAFAVRLASTRSVVSAITKLAAALQTAEKRFTRHATLVSGAAVPTARDHIAASMVHSGYPGGWAVPQLHTQVSNSPESPPGTLG
jgi:hypothetical protein